jgi:hypothetical protein
MATSRYARAAISIPLLGVLACQRASPPPATATAPAPTRAEFTLSDEGRDCLVLRWLYKDVAKRLPGFSPVEGTQSVRIDPTNVRELLGAIEATGGVKKPLRSARVSALADEARYKLLAHAVELRSLVGAYERRDATAYRTASASVSISEAVVQGVDARLADVCQGKVLQSGGRLAPAEIQQVVRGHYASFRTCYERGLARNTKLEGHVVVRFVIGADGSVETVQNVVQQPPVDDADEFLRTVGVPDPPRTEPTSLPDEEVVTCILNEYQKLRFPAPAGGKVTVVYPIRFSPE